MYRIPKDVEIEMQRLYPDLDIPTLVHQLFTKLIEKTFNDGACSIRELGKFISFKAYSSKLNREIVKLKFKIATSLIKRIRFDDFLLNSLPLQGVSEFSDKHKKACLNKEAQKAANQSVYSQATQSEKEKTQDRLGKLEILKVLEED